MPLELEHALVQLAGQTHPAVHVDEVFLGQVGFEFLVHLGVLVENLKVGNREFRDFLLRHLGSFASRGDVTRGQTPDRPLAGRARG